ncbi:type-4 ice-structuring protein LS-12-like [Engraulis encrasicolus]|uniref:type-4 ice-structuring protein LS-12-like n=1 Tax=Engraulis encrasicolus TaxID=184585 RepID=UPI002FD0811B
MKVALVAVLVVLALSHGSVSADANADLERLTQYFQDLSAKLTSTTQELVETLKTHELAAQAQTYLQDGKAQLEPLAQQIQSQIQPLAANMEEQLKPLAESVQAQLRPLADSVQAQMEDLFKKLMEQTKTIGQ